MNSNKWFILTVVIFLLMVTAFLVSGAEPPPTPAQELQQCQSIRDQWEIRHQIVQETLSQRDASIAALAQANKSLAKQVQDLQEQLKAKPPEKTDKK